MKFQSVTGDFPTADRSAKQVDRIVSEQWLALISSAALSSRDVQAAQAIVAILTPKHASAEIPLQEIGRRMGASRTTARRATHSLRDRGFLSFRQDPEEYGANVFRLRLPRDGARR